MIYEYTYNAEGLRSRKTSGDETINFIYEGGYIILETNADEAITARNVWGFRLLYRQAGDTQYGYIFNGHGDIIKLTDRNGNELEDYSYDPYGRQDGEKENGFSKTFRWEAETDNDAVNNPFRYCGEYYDLETNFYYLRARYYDPTIGRFLSEDTYIGQATDPLSLNLYTYCSNNPINFTDPTGHWHKSDGYRPEWAQLLIIEDTKQYNIAKANNDAAGMEKAHEHAKDIRRYAARANTYNMMQFFGVSDPTEIELPDNAMVFLENTQSVSIFKTGASMIRGHTIVMNFDKYCEYDFHGLGYGPTGIPLGDINVTGGYVYNIINPTDFAGFFAGASANLPSNSTGVSGAFNGVYMEVFGGESSVAGSAGFSATWYNQRQSQWVYGKANINWYNSPKSSFNPFNPTPYI